MSLPIDASHRECNASARMRARGFTLIELVAVIVILGVLAVVALPTLLDLRTDARNASIRAQAHALHAGLENARTRWRMVPGGGAAVQDLAGVGDGTWDFDELGNLLGRSYAGSGALGNDNCREIWDAVLASHAPAAVSAPGALSPNAIRTYYQSGLGCMYVLLDETASHVGANGGNVYLGYDPLGEGTAQRGTVYYHPVDMGGTVLLPPN